MLLLTCTTGNGLHNLLLTVIPIISVIVKCPISTSLMTLRTTLVGTLREILPITSTPLLTRFPMNIHQLGLDQCCMIPLQPIPLSKNVLDVGIKQLPVSQWDTP